MFHYDLSVKYSHIPSQKSLNFLNLCFPPHNLLTTCAQGCISVQYAEVALTIFSVPVAISNSHFSMM